MPICPAGRAPCAGSGHFVARIGLRVGAPDGRELGFGAGLVGAGVKTPIEVRRRSWFRRLGRDRS